MKKPRVEKTRNSGTMSEAAFWSWIRAKLRTASMYWKPVSEARNAVKVPYDGPNKRQKVAFICNQCGNAFSAKQINVHHIKECGTLTCAEDLPQFVKNLFCEVDGLMVLCVGCHDSFHKGEFKLKKKKNARIEKR